MYRPIIDNDRVLVSSDVNDFSHEAVSSAVKFFPIVSLVKSATSILDDRNEL